MKKLGFGLMRLPTTDPKDQKSIDMPQLERMVDAFLERGYTYFDTASMYHDHQSEIAIREALVKRTASPSPRSSPPCSSRRRGIRSEFSRNSARSAAWSSLTTTSCIT